MFPVKAVRIKDQKEKKAKAKDDAKKRKEGRMLFLDAKRSVFVNKRNVWPLG